MPSTLWGARSARASPGAPSKMPARSAGPTQALLLMANPNESRQGRWWPTLANGYVPFW